MNITHKGHLHHQKQLFAHYLKIKIVYPMEEQKDIKYQGILRYPSVTLQAVGDYI